MHKFLEYILSKLVLDKTEILCSFISLQNVSATKKYFLPSKLVLIHTHTHTHQIQKFYKKLQWILQKIEKDRMILKPIYEISITLIFVTVPDKK